MRENTEQEKSEYGHFSRSVSVARNCLRPESAPLINLEEYRYITEII